jgi:hypothetical protein
MISYYMNSYNDVNSSDHMNSTNNMNSSEYMNSHNGMNSSDYMNSYIPLCVFVPDEELDCLNDSQVKFFCLDDTQQYLSKSHHEIVFDYDKDTVSLVEELTLTTSEVSLSDNSISSAGNASIAFEYYRFKIVAEAPQFNYHGPKIKILKQELPMTICTADTIGTIRSQRLFQKLFDSCSNVSMIKRSALPVGVITKLLGDTKLVRTLPGCLQMQEASQCKT